MKVRNIILTILTILPFIQVKAQTLVSDATPISSDRETVTNCPFLTKDSKGVTVLSFGKEIKDNQAIFCYSVFDEKSKKFQSLIEIPSSKGVSLHGENIPKIIFKPNNEIIAVWVTSNPSEKKKYGGLIYYSQSFDNGKNWTQATPLVKDPESIDQRYFDVDLLPNGEVAIIWLDNRTKTDAEGSTVYYATTNGNSGFINEKPIAETICQCCRTELFVSKNGTINAAFRDIIDNEVRDMVLTYSTDGGSTFSAPARISPDNWKINACPHTGPSMTENENGLHFAWYTSGGGTGVFYTDSKDGKNFSTRNVISENATSKHPQITSINQDILIVWDEATAKNDFYTSHIGLQHRKNGKIISTKHISPEDKNATYPVIKMINSKQFIVAWTQKSDFSAVHYKVMTLE